MMPDDFVQNTGSTLHSYQVRDLTLYFANEKGDALVPETVSVRYNSNLSVEKLIVEQLIKGPSQEGERAVVPPETQVLGVSSRDGICYVNLDQEFLRGVSGVDPEVAGLCDRKFRDRGRRCQPGTDPGKRGDRCLLYESCNAK